MSDDLPVVLQNMSHESRRQLARDVHAHGAQVLGEGLGERQIARHLPHLSSRRQKRLAAWAAVKRRGIDVPLTAPEPEPEENGDESEAQLLERRARAYEQKARHAVLGRVARRVLRDDLPVAFCFVGDQHIDSDGTNLDQLLDDLRTADRTQGMYLINLGDITNNWQGRLERLWAYQGTTKEDADRLLRVVLRFPWYAFVLGNHDHWNEGAKILSAMIGHTPVMAQHDLRLEIEWPCGWRRRIRCRHTFRGSSIYNKTHGAKRASLFDGGWGDIYVQGHHHESSAVVEACDDQRWRVFGKAAGYKKIDSYADEHGFSTTWQGGTLVVICDPHAPLGDQMQICWDVEEAAARLTELRRRRAA